MNETETETLLEQLRAQYAAYGQQAEDYIEALRYTRFTTYWEYLNLDALLSLQTPRSNQPDELIFIIYHQITELFFRLARHELDQICQADPLSALDLPEKLRRINTYFEQLTQSFGIMTQGMEPEQFTKLRRALLPASGFQSAQYRFIELQCTDLIRLVESGRREFLGEVSLAKQFDFIYWKRGATDAQTGEKTLTLQHFEEKYEAPLRSHAEQHQHTNLRQRYPQWTHTQDAGPRELTYQRLRELDLWINVRWPKAHLGAAAHYLGGAPPERATGGTNWPEYLPPRRQQRMFFPELWSEEAHRRWGSFQRIDELES